MVLNKEKVELLRNSKKVLLVVSDNEKISHMYNLYICLKEMGKEVEVYLCDSRFYMCDIININNTVCDCILYFPSYGHDRIKTSGVCYLYKLIVIQGIHYNFELKNFNLVKDSFKESISYEHDLREILDAIFCKIDLPYKWYEFTYAITLYNRLLNGEEPNLQHLFEALYQIQVKGAGVKETEYRLLNIPNLTLAMYINDIPYRVRFENGKLTLYVYTARKEVECVVTFDYDETEIDLTARYINILKAMLQITDGMQYMLKDRSNKFVIHVNNTERKIDVTARD